jgi:predicted RNA binding protein YcfA (HicA-like mRNA interferase family)
MDARSLRRYAESKGWAFIRRGGRRSHLIFRHRDHKYLVVIPEHGGRSISKGLLNDLLKQIDGTWEGPHS